jgi:peptidoglycan/xylan/chitin deacetylase (PgdA/CDA1 family)
MADNTRTTVCLSFDFDALSSWIGFFKTKSPASISRGEFGAVGAQRILALLAKYEVTATFFIPGHTAYAYPDVVRRIADEGHEIGHHGWVHENPALLNATEERAVMERGFEALDRAAGVRPIGYRSPGADFSSSTVALLLEYGFLYDSSCSAHDFYPYYLRQGDVWSDSEPFGFGELTSLVEIPFAWHLDDAVIFELYPPTNTNQYAPSVAREIWQGEFDFGYDECQGGVFVLTMHPQTIGRGHRLRMLEEFIRYLQGHEGVKFATVREYADGWSRANALSEWRETHQLEAGLRSLRPA